MKPDTEGRRDKSKKCKYHNDFGHTLNDCYAFKKEVSKMADGGQLKEYLKGTQKMAHVNLIEQDVITVCHAQAAVCSSNRERKWSMKRKIQKIECNALQVFVVNTRRRKREQAERASSESIDPVDAEDRQTLASLRKQLKRKDPTLNDSDQGMDPGNLSSIGGDREDTGGDIIPTESEKFESEAESEEETLDDLEIRDLEILALEKSDWRLPFIEYLNSGNLPIEKALSQKQLVKYQENMKRSHDRKLRERVFKPGDWILRKAKNFDNPSSGKFSQNWEGHSLWIGWHLKGLIT
ncbi:hypothetical protein IFM89_010970 [Coptis chinensis]|uniref:Uncharacterized protein n=1 Tax=Coptis chinensis TaxID=261450 RepID=A0A835ILX0_9MAGN|nr:hypothetical protein IFM89_010970 [Coptis chinensis]